MANINLDKINRRQEPAPLYCVVGDELLLRIEAVDALRQWAYEHGYSERSSLSLNATDDWGVIEEFTQSMSLFAERKLLELVIPSGKPGRKGAEALVSLAEQAKQGQLIDTVIVISFPELDWQTKKTKWWQTLSTVAQTADLPKITREQLPHWIAQRLRRKSNQSIKKPLIGLSIKLKAIYLLLIKKYLNWVLAILKAK
ncbi:DNA polymerase III subunit delta [Oligella ureolytica]